jgi:hypothetical protein
MSKLDASQFDASLLEAAMKVKKESAYNPTCSMNDLQAEPSGSKGDAMPSTSLNIAYESKKKKMKKEGVFGDQEVNPGGPAQYHKEETEKSFDAKKDARMSINQLKSVLHNTTELLAMIKPDDLLPEWVETKITLAEDYMVTCSNFLRSDRTK